MPLILAIEPDLGQADAVRRAVRSLPGIDLVLVDSRDAALAVLKGRVPDMILLSALMLPGDEAALTAGLRTAPGAAHVEMITIPLLEHGPGFDEGKRGLFGFGRRRISNAGRINPRDFARELRSHLERIGEAVETSALARQRKLKEEAAAPPADEPSAEPDVESADQEWTGPDDAFGERTFGIDEQGQAIELLRLPPEFSGARNAISDRMVRLMDVHRSSVAQAFRLDDDGQSGRLILVSERVSGLRVSELLARAAERSVVADLPAALFVLRRLLSIAASVQARTGVAHLAIAPERIVVTPRAEIVIVEAALAAAIESRRGVDVAEAKVCADLEQIALVGLSMILGRMVAPDARTDRGDALSEAAEVAAIRVSESYAAALRSWFDQALTGDAAASFPDFQEAAFAFECVGPAREDGSVALRRTLRSFLLEIGNLTDPEEVAIEATRVRVARARQIARRHATFASQEAAPPEPEVSFARSEANIFVEPHIFVEPQQESVALEKTGDAFQPSIEETPAAAELAGRRPTLLELFRSARAAESDLDFTPSPIGQMAPPEPVVAPPVDERPIEERFAQLIPIFTEPTDESPSSEVPETQVSEALEVRATSAERLVEPEEDIQPPSFEEIHPATVEEIQPPTVEEIQAPSAEEVPQRIEEDIQPPIEEPPPVPPHVERVRPSLLELFRSSRSREREPEDVSILAPQETASEPLISPTASEPPLPAEIVADSVEAVTAIVGTEAFEEPKQKVQTPIEPAPHEQPQPARRPSLLEFLRSARFGKPKPAPEPPPPPAPEPVVAAAPKENEPLNDVFAELIHAARNVMPNATGARMKGGPRRSGPPAEEPEAPAIAEPPAPVFADPVEFAAPITEATEAAWTDEPAETAPVFAEPSAEPSAESSAEPADWPHWKLPETDRSEPNQEDSAKVMEPPHEDIQPSDENEWSSWTADESTERQPTHDDEVISPPPEPAPLPKKRRKPSLLELFRSSRSGETSEAQHAEEPESEIESVAPRAMPDHIDEEFAAFEAAHVAEPPQIPAFADVPPPAPLRAPTTNVAPQAPPPSYGPPPAPPAYVPPPAPPAYVPPPAAPTYVAPPPPTYIAPPPAQSIGLATPITIEPAPRPTPFARPADLGAQPTYAPVIFRGPVTRKATTGARPRRWTGVAVATVALACLAIAGRAYYFSTPAPVTAVEESVRKPTTVNAKGTGSLAVTSEPPGARVTVDGKPRGVTPITIASLRAGAHKVVIDSGEGTVRRDVKIVAGRETALDESIYSGWVAVYAPFELQISEGTRLLGTTDSQIMLAPGRHQLEITNSQLGYRETRGVEVTPGETTTINIKAAEGIVRINAPDGAEVWIDGERVGQTPFGDLRVPIGARDIVVRHPEFGEQHTVANVTIGSRAEVTIDFRRRR